MRQDEEVRKNLIIGGIVLIILGFALSLALPIILVPISEKIKYQEVPPLHYGTLTFFLKQGDRIEGEFTVRGGNDDIIFYIKDPYGNIIYEPAGQVHGWHKFSITASSNGAYTLYFDNTFSLITSKSVYLTIRICSCGLLETARIIGISVMILGAIIVAIGMILKPKVKEAKV